MIKAIGERNPPNEIIDPKVVDNLTSLMSLLLWRYFLKYQRNPHNIHIPVSSRHRIKLMVGARLHWSTFQHDHDKTWT